MPISHHTNFSSPHTELRYFKSGRCEKVISLQSNESEAELDAHVEKSFHYTPSPRPDLAALMFVIRVTAVTGACDADISRSDAVLQLQGHKVMHKNGLSGRNN